jgi:hypothetical protein
VCNAASTVTVSYMQALLSELEDGMVVFHTQALEDPAIPRGLEFHDFMISRADQTQARQDVSASLHLTCQNRNAS